MNGHAGATSGDRGRTCVTGVRANLGQFVLLVAVNALVGGMLGQERTILPLLASREFGVTAYTAALGFIVAFGAAKAVTNYVAGAWADRFGRKPVLVAGWVAAIPVPLLVVWAPTWTWVIVANVLLGISQGLTWSTTVTMKIDLAGPHRRGLAMGLNEAAGYGAVAATALATGYLAARYGLRPEPFYLGMAFAALGFGISSFAVRETRDHAYAEAAGPIGPGTGGRSGLPADLTGPQVFAQGSLREPSLSAASQAGMVNNLNDGLAWGIFPLLFAASGLSLERIGMLAAAYPAVWGLGQLFTGAWSDAVGRKRPIVGGMLLQAAALAVVAFATSFGVWLAALVALGFGTAMVYPALLAVVSDVAHPAWRARAIGTYRLWRDAGFVVGALVSGVVADSFGVRAAVAVVAGVTAASGVVVAVRMYETVDSRPTSSAAGIGSSST